MPVKPRTVQSLPEAIAGAKRKLMSLRAALKIAKKTFAETKQELDKAKAEKAGLVNPATYLRWKAQAKKTAKSLNPLDHLLMVNDVVDNEDKLEQLSQRVRSCTAAHKKSRRRVPSLEFDIKDATRNLEHLRALLRGRK